MYITIHCLYWRLLLESVKKEYSMVSILICKLEVLI